MSKLEIIRASEMKVEHDQNPGLVWKTGANGDKIWMGNLQVEVNVESKPQHHKDSEVALYLLEGKAEILHGTNFETTENVEEGDFVYIPPFTPYLIKTSGVKAKFITAMATSFNVELLDGQQNLPTSDETVQVVKANNLDDSTNQTSNMPRKTGVQSPHLWIGRVTGAPAKDSGAHHHGEADTGGFIISGNTRILYGENYEQYFDFEPGDYVHVPPFLPHIERNMSTDVPVEFVTTRNPRNIVVNLED